MVGKKACPLAARIKKIMQKDEDVGKIAQASPVLIARAMELLLKKLCEKAYEVAQSRQAKTVSTSHLKSCVMEEETMDFLKDVVASAPDLAAPEEQAPAKPKRRRKASGDAAEDNEEGSSSPAVEKPKRAPRAKKPKQEPDDAEGEKDVEPCHRPARRKSKSAAAKAADGPDLSTIDWGPMPDDPTVYEEEDTGQPMDFEGGSVEAGSFETGSLEAGSLEAGDLQHGTATAPADDAAPVQFTGGDGAVGASFEIYEEENAPDSLAVPWSVAEAVTTVEEVMAAAAAALPAEELEDASVPSASEEPAAVMAAAAAVVSAANAAVAAMHPPGSSREPVPGNANKFSLRSKHPLSFRSSHPLSIRQPSTSAPVPESGLVKQEDACHEEQETEERGLLPPKEEPTAETAAVAAEDEFTAAEPAYPGGVQLAHFAAPSGPDYDDDYDDDYDG